MDSYCTVADLFTFAPELRNEVDAGTILADTRAVYIKQGTIDVKNALQGQYTLDDVETQLTASNLDTIRDMTAIRSAWIAISTFQLGKSGDSRMGFLDKRYIIYKQLIAKGSLRCNDGTYLSAVNIVQDLPSTLPRALQEVYRDGPRLGIPTTAFVNG